MRFPLAAALPFLAGSAPWFTIVLGLALVSDVADGWLARRLDVAGPAGARLDSAADAVLYLSAATAALLAVAPASRALPLVVVAVGALRGAALVTARVRFGTWAMVHTWANRVAGAGAAVVVLAMVWSAEADARLVVAAGVVAAAAAVEEWWLVSTRPELDPDCRGALWGRPGRTARP